MIPIIDFHNHPSMKPYNNQGYKEDIDIWNGMSADQENYYILSKTVRKLIQETARDSQSQLREWIKGQLIVSVSAIHPTERGWFRDNKQRHGRIRKWLLRLVLKKKHIPNLAAALTGFPLKKVERIRNRVLAGQGIDYFHEPTFEEYQFLKENQNTKGPWGFTYTIVNDYDDFIQVKNNEKQLGIILSIEGGHALTSVTNAGWLTTVYDQLTDEDKTAFTSTLESNIRHMKGVGDQQGFNFEHTPFFVTLVHMYNNLLAGHAKSYGAGHGIIPGMDDLLDQKVGLNDGITAAGWKAIDLLLRRDIGRRVLIDVKHLSMKSRNEYYEYVRTKRASGDFIPIIASHAAVNGFDKNDIHRTDSFDLDKNTYLSRWSINLSNQDIREIHGSDGIIGLVIHEGRTPGGRSKKIIKKLKKRITKGGARAYASQIELDAFYRSLIISNIFQVILAIGEKSAWNRLCIGSDYDGIMDPFNCYPKTGDFHQLITDIKDFLKNPSPIKIYKHDKLLELSTAQVVELLFDWTPEELANKIAYENAEQFLSKYFTKQYLEIG